MPNHVPTPNGLFTVQKFKSVLRHQIDFFRFRNKSEIPTDADPSFEDYFSAKNPSAAAQPIVDPTYVSSFKPGAEENKLQEDKLDMLGPQYSGRAKELVRRPPNAVQQLGDRVYVFPSLQIPAIGFKEDEEVMQRVLEDATKAETCREIRLASGYLSLPRPYLKKILDTKVPVRLLAASPQANGFHNAGFFKKWIPIFYRCFEYRLMKMIKGKDNIKLEEYFKPNWTYHGKGCWFYEKGQPHPSMSIIGSSNYCITL